MSEVKSGDTVRIHYTGSLTDGSVFDSSEGRDPLEFTVGTGQVIKGMDAGLEGMAVGEKKTLNIPCLELTARSTGRPPVDPARRHPGGYPAGGWRSAADAVARRSGEPVTVVELEDETVTLDANHFLAGKDLVFEIELVSVN